MNSTSVLGPDLPGLYAGHVAHMQERCARVMSKCGFDAILIASGVQKHGFLDDKPYAFQPNPHFLSWLPLAAPGCWLLIRPGRPPVLARYQPDDYWHAPPAPAQVEWMSQIEVMPMRSADKAADALLPLAGGKSAFESGRVAIIGEADAAIGGLVPNNPPRVLAALDWARGEKTPYELHCLREASRIATRAHTAAYETFLAGGSEHDIFRASLHAGGQTERDLPYPSIVALNEHSAVLHYQNQDRSAPERRYSLILDAGAQFAGYASDITRTLAGEDAPLQFRELVLALDAAQRRLVAGVREGVDYRHLQLAAHGEIASILIDAGIVSMSVEAALAEGVTSTFFPHGLGHLLGLQVHDVGGTMADEFGERTEPPLEGHPFLRLRRPIVPGMVLTVEPGLYFIPMLLDRLRVHRAASRIDWRLVHHLMPCGGIRIEDDVCCRAGAHPENLTREAFAA